VATRALAHRALRGARYEQIAAGAKQDSHFIESVRGLRAIKSFRRAEERRSAWLSLLIEQVNAGLRAERLQLLLRSTSGLLFGLENVLVIYAGASLVLEVELSTGMLLAFLAYKRQFTSRVSTLVDKAFEMRLLRRPRACRRLLTAPEERWQAAADGVGWRWLRRFRYAAYVFGMPSMNRTCRWLDLAVAAGESVMWAVGLREDDAAEHRARHLKPTTARV
jgi:ATP-binding cassette subfamily B protein RaxB